MFECSNPHLAERRSVEAQKLGRIIRNNAAPWLIRDREPRLPYRHDDGRYYDTYHSLLMIAEGRERGYKHTCWVDFEQVRDNGLFIRKGEKGLSLEDTSFVTDMRNAETGEVVKGKEAFTRFPSHRYNGYFNAHQVQLRPGLTNFIRGIEFHPSESVNGMIARDEFAKVHNIDLKNERISPALYSFVQDFAEKCGPEDFSGARDRRYEGLSEAESTLLYSNFVNMVQHRLCAEMAVDFEPYYPFDKDELNNTAELFEKRPELFLAVTHSCDRECDIAFGRESVKSLFYVSVSEKNLVKFNRNYGLEKSFEPDAPLVVVREPDELIYPGLDNELSNPVIKDALANIEDGEKLVVVLYQDPSNLFNRLPDGVISFKDANKAFFDADEQEKESGGHYPVKFAVISKENGRSALYIGRYDLGMGENGLFRHIREFTDELSNSPQYGAYLYSEGKYAEFSYKMDELSFISSRLIPTYADGLGIDLEPKQVIMPDEVSQDYKIGDELDAVIDEPGPEPFGTEAGEVDINNKKEVNKMAENVVDSAAGSGRSSSQAGAAKARDGDFFEFPDGERVYPEFAKWPSNNGYDPNVIDITMKPRYASKSEIELMQSWNHLEVDYTKPVLRRDYMKSLVMEVEKKSLALAGVREAQKHARENVGVARSKSEYLFNARENAKLAEGDRIADEKENAVYRMKEARKYRERLRQEVDIPVSNNNSKEEPEMADNEKNGKKFYMSKETAAKDASPAQIGMIIAKYKFLSPYYQKNLDPIALEQARKDAKAVPGLTMGIAADAIRGANAREKLQKYLDEKDPRWEKMTTKEAEALAEAYDGKITLNQQKMLAARGVEFDMTMTKEKAHEIISGFPASQNQLEAVRKLNKDLAKDGLTAGRADEILKAAKSAREKMTNEPVPDYIYKHALKHNLISEGQPYTMGQWKKDCYDCPPTEDLVAKVERYNLYGKIHAYMENYPERYTKESMALYKIVVDKNEQMLADKINAPCTEKQLAFLKKNGVELDVNATYAQANDAMCKLGYENRLIGKTNMEYLRAHPEVELPKGFVEASKEFKVLPVEEREAIRKEAIEHIHAQKIADRMDAIAKAPLIPRETNMRETVLKIAHDYREKHGTLDGCEKECAKALVCGNFVISDYARTNMTRFVKDTEITNSHVLANVITNTLPSGVKDYKASLESNLKLVKTAEKALEKENAKAKIKEEAKSKAAEKGKSADKSKGNDGMES